MLNADSGLATKELVPIYSLQNFEVY
jgi:hypothetical protein